MMRRARYLGCLVLFYFAAVPGFSQVQSFRVLAFYSTNVEQDHVDFATAAIPFFQDMAKRDHFEFKATSNWNDLAPAVLKDYQVVLWLNEFPSTPAQRAAFAEYMEHGGTWMGFHVAGWMESRESWPWFADFLGTMFSGNSWPPMPATISVDDRDHPATKGMPVSFVSPDNEWYSWQPSPRNNSKIKVLMTLAPTNYPLGFKDTLGGGDIPVTWTNTKYKMLYTNMGHCAKVLSSPVQNQFFESALLWLGGRRDRLPSARMLAQSKMSRLCR
jgi:type 1 glutamine amidotransferase